MKDALIKKLNDRLANQVQTQIPGNNTRTSVGASKFDQILSTKSSSHDVLANLVDKVMGDDPLKSKIQSMPADDIKITVANPEYGTQSNFTAKGAVDEIFTEMNKQFHRMDDIVEVLGSGKKLSRSQLLQYQFIAGEHMKYVEFGSRFLQQAQSAFNGVLNTNVG